jgi:hypothetical protein
VPTAASPAMAARDMPYSLVAELVQGVARGVPVLAEDGHKFTLVKGRGLCPPCRHG